MKRLIVLLFVINACILLMKNDNKTTVVYVTNNIHNNFVIEKAIVPLPKSSANEPSDVFADTKSTDETKSTADTKSTDETKSTETESIDVIAETLQEQENSMNLTNEILLRKFIEDDFNISKNLKYVFQFDPNIMYEHGIIRGER